MPDYSTEVTRLVESQLGPMEYDMGSHKNIWTVERGPCDLGDGTVYYGQWISGGKRNGKGIQIWTNG